MSRLICTRGLPGSGKTTYALGLLAAAEPGMLVRVNRDSIAAMLHGKRPHLPVTEGQITVAHHGMVDSYLKRGVDVIVDDTLLRTSNLRDLFKIAWKYGAETEVVDFDVPVDECVRRDSLRPHPVGEDAIRGMHKRFLHKWPAIPQKPAVAPAGAPYIPNRTLPKAVIFDIDGTVADNDGHDPYDGSKYNLHKPKTDVIYAIRAMVEAGCVGLGVSGRKEMFRDATETWLDEHLLFSYRGLHMREEADYGRPDNVIKLEMFDKYIRNNWNVVAVFDDRTRVVEAWRSIGLTVFQVAQHDF